VFFDATDGRCQHYEYTDRPNLFVLALLLVLLSGTLNSVKYMAVVQTDVTSSFNYT